MDRICNLRNCYYYRYHFLHSFTQYH